MLLFGAVLLLCSAPAEAQFLRKLTKKLEKKLDKTTEKLEQKVDDKIDKVLDMDEDTSSDEGREMDEPMQESEMETSSPDDQGVVMDADPGDVSFASYSKYDFTPGIDLIAFEDFSQESIGDFPSLWNTNASAEVVTLSNQEGKWMRIGQGRGTFTFSNFETPLPQDFTLEFDMVFDFDASAYAFKRYLQVLFSDLDNPDTYLSDFSPSKEFVLINFTNGSGSGRYVSLQRETSQSGMDVRSENPHPFFSKNAQIGMPAHISILKKGSRLKVYVNEDKVIDVPRAFLEGVPMNSMRFQSEISPANQHFFISNIKYATGVTIPERLFDTGSYQAHGIQFDSGSAQLKPESYGTIKKVAQAIQANLGSTFVIVGHTDNDGDYTINVPLSKERAQTVYEVLVNTFEIDASNLQIEGVGSSQPLSQENTAVAKAQNRRVEIKKI